mgnify:CR=1 FL=1
MSSVNKVILVGNLGADPESRAMQNGSVANMRVATTEVYKDRDGNRKEATEWHNVVIFNERLVDFAEKYLRKGSQVYIEGKLRTRKWQDRDGNDKFTTEVVIERFSGELKVLGSRSDSGENRGGDRTDDQRSDSRQSDRGGSQGGGTDLDDDVPF